MPKIYDHTIDVLRLISILAVVLIHTTTRTLEISHYDLVNHELTLFLNQSARFAVPLFFLISGYVLTLNYIPTNYLTFLKKRFSKILIPYLFWSAIYYFFIYTNHSDNFLQAALDGSASWQLYFIPALLVFYALFPAIMKFYKLITKPLPLLVLFVIQLLILNYDYRYHNSPIFYPVEVFLFNYFAFLFGMFISKNRNFLKIKLMPLLAIPMLYMAYFIFHEGLINYYKTWNYIYFYSQWRPSVLIYTLLLFIVLYFLLKNIQSKFIFTLSKLSFFVFFVHIIFLELLYKYLYREDLLFFVSVASLSFIAAYLAYKIKLLPKLTG